MEWGRQTSAQASDEPLASFAIEAVVATRVDDYDQSTIEDPPRALVAVPSGDEWSPGSSPRSPRRASSSSFQGQVTLTLDDSGEEPLGITAFEQFDLMRRSKR